MRSIFLTVLFVATVAQAQSGVPLFTPAPALSAADQARADQMMKSNANILSITPVTVNPYAIESNVITVKIEGREYRYGVTYRYKKEGQPEEWAGCIVGANPNETTNLVALFRDSSTGTIRGTFMVWAPPPPGSPPDHYVHKLEPGMLIKESLRATRPMTVAPLPAPTPDGTTVATRP